MDNPASVQLKINPEGWKFIPIFAAVAVLLFLLWEPLGWIGVVLTLWCAYFFRDPERATPTREGLVIAPADGKVILVGPAVPPKELDMGDDPVQRICIFMNVFNVHVNRIPMDGVIKTWAYRKGKFVNAAAEKASEDNEAMAIRMTTKSGKDMAFVQIAGLVARRIKCDLRDGQEVRAGERFGLIRFGSRVDVYLPEGLESQVAVGQTTVAGETVLADEQSQEDKREGDVR